jgi:hypothetical protein
VLVGFIQGLPVCRASDGSARPLIFYFEKIKALKAGKCLNALAWNNKTRPLASLVVSAVGESFVGFGPG